MIARISIADVIKETLDLFGQRKKYVVVMFFLLFAVTAPFEWLLSTVVNDSLAISGSWWMLLLIVLLDTAIQAAIFNFFITALRNEEPRLVPGGLLAKTGRVLFREILVILAALIPGALVLALCVGISLVLHPIVLTDPGFSHYFQMIVVLGLSLGICWPILRLGAGIAGAAVDEKVSFAESWRITRGHSLGLFLFFLPLMVVPVLTSWAITPEFGSYGLFSPETLIQAVLSTLIYGFYFAGFSVWYVRLRDRYAAMLTEGMNPTGGKLSPWAVVKEAVILSWSRKWTFCGVMLIGLLLAVGVVVSSLQGIFQIRQAPMLTVALFCLAFVLNILGITFLGITGSHLAVTLQRGQGIVFPDRLLAALWRVFVRGVILILGYLAVVILLTVPLGVLFYYVLPLNGAAPDHASLAAMGLLFIVAMVGCILILVLFLRFMVMIPGAAVGHVVKVREAWAMTRGYSWRMFGAMLIQCVPTLILIVIFNCLFLVMGGNGGYKNFWWGQALPLLSILAVQICAWIIGLVVNAIWYEKLRLRFEHGTA